MNSLELSKKKWLKNFFCGVSSVVLADSSYVASISNAYEITRNESDEGKFTIPQPIIGIGSTEDSSYSALFDRVAVDMVSRGKFICMGVLKEGQNFSIIPDLKYEMIERGDIRHSHDSLTLFDFYMRSVDDDQSIINYDFDDVHCHLLNPFQ